MGALRRGLPSAIAGAVACGLVLHLAWHAGGYFPDSHVAAGAVAFATLAVLLAVRPPYYALSTPALVALSALGGLTLWTALSSTWSSAPDTALEDFQRDLLYVGVLGLGLLAAGSGRYSRHLPWAVLAVGTAIVGAGLLSRLAPDLVQGVESSLSDYRLAYPLSYWNAFGALGVLVLVLALGLAADARSRLTLRCLAAACTVPVGTAAYLSFSRGAWLALFLGLAVLVVLSPDRASLAATALACLGALTIAILRLRHYPALTEDPGAGIGQVASGRAFWPLLAALAAGAAGAQALLSLRWAPEHAREGLRRHARRVAAAVGVLALVAFAGVYALRSEAVEGRAAGRLDSISTWVGDRWGEFMAPAMFAGDNQSRLTHARGTRSDLYRVAIDGFEADPLRGDGSGGFEYRYAHERDTSDKVRDAHSLYLETLGELGAPGALLLLGFVGTMAWAGVTARRRQDALTGGQAAAVCAACAVWIGHAGVDWDWQVPALTAPAILLSASAFPVGRRGRRRRDRNAGHGGPALVPSAPAPSSPRVDAGAAAADQTSRSTA
jgi:hypothetical protein